MEVPHLEKHGGRWDIGKGQTAGPPSQLRAENAAQTPALPILLVTASQFCHLWALVSPSGAEVVSRFSLTFFFSHTLSSVCVVKLGKLRTTQKVP